MQAHLGLPAQRLQAAAVHQLARCTVGLAGVKVDLAGVAHHLTHGAGQLGNGDVAAIAHVDVALHGVGVLVVGGLGQVHDVHAGRCHVVHKQKFAAWRAGAPDGDLGRVAGLGLVKAADQRGDDVAVFRVVVVAGAVQVGGHDAAVVHAVAGAILAVVAFAELNTGNFGNGIGLVGRFKRTSEQGIFGHGLRGLPRVNAAGAEEQQFFDAVLKRCVNHVGLQQQVLVNEFGRVGVVGMNASYLGGGQIDLVGFFGMKEGAHGGLIGQVKFGMGAGDDSFRVVASGQQLADDGGADHAAVACNVYLGCGSGHIYSGLDLQSRQAAVGVFKSHNVVFTQIPARLHLDKFKVNFSGIF